MSGAVNQKAFANVIRENRSFQADAMTIASLQPAALDRPAKDAQRQVE